MQNRGFIFLLYLLLDFIGSFSQSNLKIFYPVNNQVLQQYNIRSLTTDRDGKLWLSTDNGLLSYDGNDVKIFKHDDNDPSSLSSDNVSKTYPDLKGNLYVINDLHEKNLSLMDGKTGKFTVLNVALKLNDIRMMATPFAFSDLFIDDDGSMWIAAYYIGLIHYNTITTRTDSYYMNEEYSGKNTVYTVKKDLSNKQVLWLGTQDGIYSFNKKTKEFVRNFRCANPADSSGADLQVMNIDVCNSDSIWFSVPGKGIGCYNIKSGYYTLYPVLNKKQKDNEASGIIQIQRKDKNEYFVSTKYSLPGVFNIHTHQYHFTAVTSQDLPSVLLNYFLVDSTGINWCILHNRLFQAHSMQNKFATIRMNSDPDKTVGENNFKNIVWSEKDKLYYAAFQKSQKIFVLDSAFQIVKTIPVIYTKKKGTAGVTEIYDLALDKKERLWVCGSTLFVYDHVSQKIIPSSEIYPQLQFKDLPFQNLVMRGDNIYLQPSTISSRAIYRININSLAPDSIILPDEIAKDKIYEYQPVRLLDYLAIDKEGINAYFGYSRYSVLGYSDCFLQFNLETKKMRKVKLLKEVEHNESSNLFKYALDDSDRIWVETSNSVVIYEPEKLHEKGNITPEAEHYGIQMLNIPGTGVMCRLSSKGIMLYDYRNNKQIHLTLNDGMVSYLNSAITFTNNYLFTGASDYIQYIPLSFINGKQATRKCYVSSILLFNRSYQTDTFPQSLQQLNMPHDKNFITLSFSSVEFEQPERLEYRYRMDGIDKDWVYVNYLNRTISYNDLKPGTYTFHAEVKNNDGKWSTDNARLSIHIIAAWWQTFAFKIFVAMTAGLLIFLLVLWRIRSVRRQEQLKGSYEKELLELEAKALRAQMNPHFIFNCMNSIKSLIQENEKSKAVVYLTTFSKLIRTIFQNSDKREITLNDEIETCRLYLELESMRFGNKFNYAINIDETLDMGYIMVPALIIQPFIENAIWHGIMHKEDNGIVTVSVEVKDNVLRCIIDDNGIGREMSKQNKFKGQPSTHQSKGVHLTQARLNLDNLLNERNGDMQVLDKKDEHGISLGTTVILSFNQY